jgi:hypothetical protein
MMLPSLPGHAAPPVMMLPSLHGHAAYPVMMLLSLPQACCFTWAYYSLTACCSSGHAAINKKTKNKSSWPNFFFATFLPVFFLTYFRQEKNPNTKDATCITAQKNAIFPRGNH